MRGDASCPSMSAAVAVRGQMRGFLGYKGAPMWMMNAGMGDTVFSPVYLVLKVLQGVGMRILQICQAIGR
jgi:hypothetical protein